MHCFVHREEHSVALCKHCYKGLCAQCTTETPYGVVCSDKCQQELDRQFALIAHAESYSKGKMSIWMALSGLIFLLWGLTFEGIHCLALSAVGVLFLGYGARLYFLQRSKK